MDKPGAQNPIKILVAEDDRLTRKLLESMFASLGMKVSFAENGLDGLELFKKEKFDIVISDYNMPEMNGLDMFAAIRAVSSAVKFVLMTIYTESDVLIRAINMGVDRFLEKPIVKDKLKSVVDALSEDVLIAKELARHQNLLKSYRSGVDSSTIFSILDTHGNFKYVNQKFCSISGYEESELLGKHYSLIRKSNKAYDVKAVKGSDNDGSTWQGCVTNISKNGQEFVTELNLLPVRNDNIVVEFISIEKDMSFLVYHHKLQLQALFDADDAVMFAFNADFKLQVCNHAFLAFFGFRNVSDVAFDSFCLQDFICDTDSEARYELGSFKEILKGKKRLFIPKLTLKKPGESKEYFFMLNMFELDLTYFGMENIFIIRLNDITELENLKKEELTSAMLASIGKLSAGITHEINTPLTYIKGNIELLEWEAEDSVSGEQLAVMKDYFNSINDGLTRISLIIESMREVTGEAKFELEEANLYSTFVVACRMVYNRSKHVAPIYINDVKMTLDADSNHEIFNASIAPKMLEQVWIILLNNSLDQLAQSDLTFDEKYIRIDIGSVGDRFKIVIRDNGGGISKDVLSKIFELFASTKKHKGMGIGLNIAKNIIEKHNGTITPYNDDNGAVFEIML